jgi:hypothetical protein
MIPTNTLTGGKTCRIDPRVDFPSDWSYLFVQRACWSILVHSLAFAAPLSRLKIRQKSRGEKSVLGSIIVSYCVFTKHHPKWGGVCSGKPLPIGPGPNGRAGLTRVCKVEAARVEPARLNRGP